jgi:hypothetical protein
MLTVLVLVGVVLSQYLLLFNMRSLLEEELVVEAMYLTSILVAVAVQEDYCLLLV